MARLSRAARSLLRAAEQESYAAQNMTALDAWAAVRAGKIPRWARQEIERWRHNFEVKAAEAERGFQRAITDDPNIAWFDSLVEIGPERSGQYRQIRTYIDPGMTMRDLLANVDLVMDDWSDEYANGQRIVAALWRAGRTSN